MRIDKRAATGLGTLAAMIVLTLLAWLLPGSGDSSPSSSPDSQTASQTSSQTSSPTSSSSQSSSSCLAQSRLPDQARDTLDLIDSDGPFPYDRDGIVFRNDEGRLPHEASGYYHEYTVTTPGESDRGARRIIAGSDGEEYYTADHYGHFALVCAA